MTAKAQRWVHGIDLDAICVSRDPMIRELVRDQTARPQPLEGRPAPAQPDRDDRRANAGGFGLQAPRTPYRTAIIGPQARED